MTSASSKPDYLVPPGEVLEEILEERGIAKQDFAERCGRTPKNISEIIAGKAVLTEETAIRFGRVLEMDPQLWVNLESNYRLRLAECEEQARIEEQASFAKCFPLNDMVRFKMIEKPESSADALKKLLRFFGAASAEALQDMIGTRQAHAVAYRRSPSFEGKPHAVMAWLHHGDRAAARMECASYDASAFRHRLKEIRGLTTANASVLIKRLTAACAEVGVAVVFVPELKGTSLSGCARWSGNRPLIQLSLRHKTDDHLWFTFFHEAGHIILHGKKGLFIDESKDDRDDPKEVEANQFASEMLIPKSDWSRFRYSADFSVPAVKAFAASSGIAPGIVVGRLQHEKAVPFNTTLNHLKQRFAWKV